MGNDCFTEDFFDENKKAYIKCYTEENQYKPPLVISIASQTRTFSSIPQFFTVTFRRASLFSFLVFRVLKSGIFILDLSIVFVSYYPVYE